MVRDPSDNAASSSAGRWRSVIALDLRSLALLRIALGLVLLLSLVERAQDVAAHYTDDGLLSREERKTLEPLEEFTAPQWQASLFMLNGEAWFQYALLGAAAGLAVLLVAGWRTPWVLFGSWVLLVGVQARNPLLLQGGDDVLRVLVFWSLFVPLGAKWSLDALRTSKSQRTPTKTWAWHPSPSVATLGTAALIVQLACIYFFTGLLKKHPIWWSEWSAVYYTLSIDHFATPFGRWLLNFPTLLQAFTLGALVLEIAGPVLLFCPWKNDWLRLAVAGGFIAFHLGLALTMELGYFPYICIAYWLVLLPPRFWEFLALCGQRWMASRLEKPARETAADSPKDAERELTRFPESRPSWAGNCLIAVLLAYVLLLNVARISGNLAAHLTAGPVKVLGDAAQLNQFWCMFAPRPNTYGGWLSLRGQLTDGTAVNLLCPELPPWDEKPPLVSAVYPTERWRKCLMNLFERDIPDHRRRVGEYFVRRWNAEHGPDQQLVSAQIVHLVESTEPPCRLRSKSDVPSRQVLWSWELTNRTQRLPGRERLP
jgi:hypothetical protein